MDLSARINALGNRTSTLYDVASQIVAAENALGNRTSFAYDPNGQQTVVRNANGHRATSVYDAVGRTIAQINALGNRTTTMYDGVGNTTALIDARGNRHSFLYDAADRELALIDPLNRRTTRAYDAAGNQTRRIDARGHRTTYAFDAASQLTQRRYPDGSRVAFAWDSVGNRTLMADATGRYSWTYEAVNRTTRNQQPHSKTISYTWDALGHKAGMLDPDGGRFTYNYDPADRIASLENPWNERTTFNYDSAGRRTLKKLANGTRASFSYDAADRLTTLANMDSTAAYISRYDYKYDNADNRTGVLEADGSRVTWSYDAANQLLAENRTGTTPYVNTFSYDPAQNRLTKNESGSLTTYSYDAANQLETSLDAGGTTTYTFDANGNQQIVRAPNGGRTTTTWDYENQPTKTVLPTSVINTAAYNGDNLRKELEDSEGTKRFVWDGTQYLLQTDGSDATQAVWTNEPGQFTTLISQRRDSATQYPHIDALGSTRQLTDAAETVTDTWLYDAWGNVLTRTGTTSFPLQFIGMHGYFFDADAGTLYIIMRIYEPETGRWLGIDPLRFIDGFNRYWYTLNRPTGGVDPSGTECESGDVCGCSFRIGCTEQPKAANKCGSLPGGTSHPKGFPKSPAGGPENNKKAVVCYYYRKTLCIVCRLGGTKVACPTVATKETDDKKQGGPIPLTELLIGKHYTHPTHKIDWHRLYPRIEDELKYYGYTSKTKTGRFAMGLHPGTISLGCVTINAPKYNDDECWKKLDALINTGKLTYKGDSDFRGFLYVFDK